MARGTIKPYNRAHAQKLDFIVPGFTNFNPSDDPVGVDDTVLVGGLNFVYDNSGSVQTAKGYVKVNTTSLPDPLDNGWMFETPTLRQLIVSTTAGKLYRYNNAGAFVQIGTNYTPGTTWNAVQAESWMFFVNGVDGILKWDGTAMTFQTMTGYAAIKPQYIVFRKGRLAMAEKDKNLVWQTEPYAYTTMTAGSYTTIESDDGDPVNSLAVDNDNLTVGKRKSIWTLVGEPTLGADSAYMGNLQLKRSNAVDGPVSQKALVKMHNGVQVYVSASGIYSHQNYASTNIVPELRDTFLNGMNASLRNLIWAQYNPEEKKLLVGYPSTTSSVCDRVIMLDLNGSEIRLGVWDDQPFTFGLMYKFNLTPSMVMGHNTKGFVTQAFTGYGHLAGDNGAATSATSTTLTDTSKNWTPGQFVDSRVQILQGSGNGQSAVVTGNTADTLTFSPAMSPAPGALSKYAVGAYHSYADTKIFDFRDPALTKKYKFLNLFVDSSPDPYSLQVGAAYAKAPLSYTQQVPLSASSWFYEADNSANGWTWGDPSLTWGGVTSIYKQLNLGGNDRFVQARWGTQGYNQPWRCSKISFTYREKKARPN